MKTLKVSTDTGNTYDIPVKDINYMIMSDGSYKIDKTPFSCVAANIDGRYQIVGNEMEAFDTSLFMGTCPSPFVKFSIYLDQLNPDTSGRVCLCSQKNTFHVARRSFVIINREAVDYEATSKRNCRNNVKHMTIVFKNGKILKAYGMNLRPLMYALAYNGKKSYNRWLCSIGHAAFHMIEIDQVSVTEWDKPQDSYMVKIRLKNGKQRTFVQKRCFKGDFSLKVFMENHEIYPRYFTFSEDGRTAVARHRWDIRPPETQPHAATKQEETDAKKQ